MTASNQRGTAILNLVIFVALWLLTTFLFFVFYGTEKIYDQDILRTNQKMEEIRNYQKTIENRLQCIESLTGFFKGEENRLYLKQARVDIEKLVKNLNKINSKEKKDIEPGTRQYYGLTMLPSPDVEIKEENLASQDYAVNIENTLKAFMARIYELQEEQDLLNKSLSKVKYDKELKTKERSEVTRQQNEILEGLDRIKKDIESKREQQIEQIKEQERKSRDEKGEVEKNRKKLEKNIQGQRLEYENLLSKKKGEIRKLQAAKYGRTSYSEITKQREFNASEEKQDGSVVFSDPRSQTVYINLGEAQKMVRGLKFDVYRQASQGIKELKGRIEIQKVMEKVSQARIIEIKNNLDPIVNGDIIVNPVFNQENPVYFVFAGRFKSISNEQAKKMIEILGSKVEEEVTAKTNFVIVGQKGQEHQNYLSALSYGIPLMTEDILLRYVGD